MARAKPKPVPPLDPAAAVAPLFAWYSQAFAVLFQLSDQATAVATELRKPDSPWREFVTDDMLDFCGDLNSLVDNHLRPPFIPAFPAVNPMAGMKGGAA
jgi:hypothetical protein